jgi:phospholipase/carboxylesterase
MRDAAAKVRPVTLITLGGLTDVRRPWQDEGMTEIDDDLTRWSADERAGKPLLVLLHGYGADENDLFGLVPYLPDGLVAASVAAPLTPPWPMPGRSWYPIDALNSRESAGVTAAAEALLRWLAPAASEASSVALLGFSQGAAVSLQALRLAPERIDAVVALRGYAAPGELPNDAALQEQKPPVFWGRGSRDDVIPPNLVDHTAEWLPGHAELSGRVYPGLTHSISEQELADVDVFLSQWKDAIGR